jgi:hypothetical protein
MWSTAECTEVERMNGSIDEVGRTARCISRQGRGVTRATRFLPPIALPCIYLPTIVPLPFILVIPKPPTHLSPLSLLHDINGGGEVLRGAEDLCREGLVHR